LVGLGIQWLINNIQSKIEYFLDYISDRKSCAFEFSKVLDFKDSKFVNEDDFLITDKIEAINNIPSPFQFFYRLKTIELRPLLFNKAKELGLISLIPQVKISPTTINKYKLNFKPKQFKPAPPESKESPELTIQDYLIMTILGLLGTTGLGYLTLYLGISKSSYWAILPGLFSIIFLILFIGGLFELLKKYRKK